jgi:hypothetical protein
MKLSRTETHDRLKQFTGAEFDIGKTCQEMLDSMPFGKYPFYIFAHKREIGMDERISIFNQDRIENPLSPRFKTMEDVPSARIIWQPRLTKPQAQENSMLFKGYPGTDNIKVIWMIPARELWDEYTRGKMLENKVVCESIHDFMNNKEKLEAKEDDDLPETTINHIYAEIANAAQRRILLGGSPRTFRTI